jgi:ribosomal RNA-processing protein 7
MFRVGKDIECIPLTLRSSPFQKFIYIKEHHTKEQSGKQVRFEKSEGKKDSSSADVGSAPASTWFVANVSHDARVSDVEEVFQSVGKVESVELSHHYTCDLENPLHERKKNELQRKFAVDMNEISGYRAPAFMDSLYGPQRAIPLSRLCSGRWKVPFAHVHFAKKMKFPPRNAKTMEHSVEKEDRLHGMDHLVSRVKMEERRSLESIRAEAESYMLDFDRHQDEVQELLKQKASMPDEDGFITVVRKSKKGPSGGSTLSVDPAVDLAQLRDQVRKKQDKMQHTDFYRFQKRERNRKVLRELREKFGQDKKRLVELRSERKFKPMEL